jgi:hypothetical protein
VSPSPDERLVGALCLLVVVPWILMTIRRGLAQGRLPIGRGYVLRVERPGPFKALLASYAVAVLLMGFIGLDLLFQIRFLIFGGPQ